MIIVATQMRRCIARARLVSTRAPAADIGIMSPARRIPAESPGATEKNRTSVTPKCAARQR
jgi:hypothetical protein